MEREEQDDRHSGSAYRQADAIGKSELRAGLMSLALFRSDPNMCQQAVNLELVDQAAMGLEVQILRKKFEERPIGREAAFLNALSQMWIFAAYELMRTWRQRARSIVKLAENRGLQAKLDQLRSDAGFTHFGREIRARQIEEVIANPSIVEQLRLDLRKIHIPFARMEMVRVAIAKHEVRGRRDSAALMPTYGRINQWSGSLDYDLGVENMILGTISRRDIADDIRSLPNADVPTDETITSFEDFMKGPTVNRRPRLTSYRRPTLTRGSGGFGVGIWGFL